jgi:nucleoside-diphosphate-sugar epimerase
MKAPVAVTGGTGFIGREVIARLVRDGWPVRALSRRRSPDLERAGVKVIQGSLDDEPALQQLVSGAGTVVHCAGAVRAPSASTYRRVNELGSARLVDAASAAASPPRFLLISSLAAREPGTSPYAGSKRLGEDAVRQRAGRAVDLCILRPPAVYGPGDRGALPIFRQLRRGLLFVPAVGSARFSLLYVADLAEMVVRLLQKPSWGGSTLEPDDGRESGYRWRDLAEIAGRQLGRRVRIVAVPRQVLWPAAAISEAAGAVLRRPPRLSRGKLRELFHADWVSRAVPDGCLATGAPRTTFESGFPQTLAWYEQNQWL